MYWLNLLHLLLVPLPRKLQYPSKEQRAIMHPYWCQHFHQHLTQQAIYASRGKCGDDAAVGWMSGMTSMRQDGSAFGGGTKYIELVC